MIKKRVKLFTGFLALLGVAAIFLIQREIQQTRMLEAYEAWLQSREAELREKDSSWLNLAGLFWMEEGDWSMGSAPENDFVLREVDAPARLGVFVRNGDEITFQCEENVAVMVDGKAAPEGPFVLQNDEEERNEPTVLSHGRLEWWIIARDGMLGVRVRDMESPQLANFEGLEHFDYDPTWNIEAQFLAFESPRVFEYPTVIGTMRAEESPGVLIFELDGRQFEMVPFERNAGARLFLVFADETNGNITYHGGRFLYLDMPDETGKTTIDFNRAYNPPCAFSPYSTCAQPLRQNKLSVSIEAGELVYEHPAHAGSTPSL